MTIKLMRLLILLFLIGCNSRPTSELHMKLSIHPDYYELDNVRFNSANEISAMIINEKPRELSINVCPDMKTSRILDITKAIKNKINTHINFSSYEKNCK